SDMDLLLETNAQGVANWDFQPQNKTTSNEKTPSTGATQLPIVHDVGLRNARITYIDGVQKSKFSVVIPEMNLNAASGDEPVRVNVNAEINDAPLDVVATVGSLDQFSNIDEKPFPLSVAITASGLLAKIDGTVHIPKTGLKVGADVSLSGTEIETMEKIVGTQLPPISKIEISARLDGNASNYKLSKINSIVGNSDISGEASINISGTKPVIKADFKSTLLDINEISSIDDKSNAKTNDKLFSSDPIDFSGLKAVDADLTYNADVIKADVLKLKKLSVEVSLKNGKLAINPLNLSVGDGYLRAQINVDGASAKPEIATKLSARGIDAGRLLSEFEFGNYLTLKTNFEADLKGAGASVSNIMSGLDGTLRIVGMNGRLNDAVISTISTGIMDALPWVSRADSNAINCVVADVPVKAGIATANKMFMDTNGMSIIGTGKANLGTETFDLTFSPRAKNVSLGSFAIPLSLSGKFSDPNLGINPAGVVVGTVSNVGNIVGGGAGAIGGLLGGVLGANDNSPPPSEYDPCLKFLSNKKNAPKAVSDKPTTNETQQPSSPTDAVKDLTNSIEKNIGGAIQGIFGNK
ncbi:MAG: AsmA family protein, partial [Rhodospirillaceae bacterium]|nr:AsmA family protein [Rhodospirillaceae bacterium]